MCTLLGWRLCKCTNLAGFAWLQAGSWIMAPALLAGRTHLKKQQVENAFFLVFLLCCLSFCPGWDMAMVQIGKSCGRFGKCLFSPLILALPSLCVIIDWREVTFKMKSRSVRKNVKAFMLSHGININSLSPPPVPLPLCLLSTSVSFLSSLSLSLSGCALSLSLCLFPFSPSLLSVYSWTA